MPYTLLDCQRASQCCWKNSLQLERGSTLLLYTDGIVEAANERQEMFGEHRLIHLMREHRRCSPKEICQAVLQEVQIHNRLVEYSDDKTLVVIKRSR